MTSIRSRSPWSILLVIAAIIAVLDQVTKRIAADALGPESDRGPITIVPSVLELRYVENTGAAFGMFQDNTSLLAILSFGVIALLALIFGGMISRSNLLGLAFGLQFGGAIGNLVDRVRQGYVVDFVDVPYWPTFNVADSGITVGVVILAFVLLIRPEWVAAPEQSETDADAAREEHQTTLDVQADYEATPRPSQDTDR